MTDAEQARLFWWLMLLVFWLLSFIVPAAIFEHRKRRRRAMRRMPVEWRPPTKNRWYAVQLRSDGDHHR